MRSCYAWLVLRWHPWLTLRNVRVHNWIHRLLARLTISLRLLTVHLRLLTIHLWLLTILLGRHQCILLSNHLVNLSLLLLHFQLLFLPISKRLLCRCLHWDHDVKHLHKITSVLVRPVANSNSGYIRLQQRT